jgi:hypothetical protein
LSDIFFFTFLGLFLFALASFLLYMAKKVKSRKMQKRLKEIIKGFKYNTPIRFFMESYLAVILSTMLGIIGVKFTTPMQIVASVMVLLLLIFFLLLPVYLAVILWKNKDDLHTDKFNGKIGAIYAGIDT